VHPAQISSEEIKRDTKYFRCMKILQNLSILVNPRFCSRELHAEVDGYCKFWVNVVSPCTTSTEHKMHKNCIQPGDYSKDTILEDFLDEENDGGNGSEHVMNCRWGLWRERFIHNFVKWGWGEHNH
jgi:hypothetical protein